MRVSAQLKLIPVAALFIAIALFVFILMANDTVEEITASSTFIGDASMRLREMESSLDQYQVTGSAEAIRDWKAKVLSLDSYLQNPPQLSPAQQTTFNSILVDINTLKTLTELVFPSNNRPVESSEIYELMIKKLYITMENMVWEIYLMEKLAKKELITKSSQLLVDISLVLGLCILLFFLMGLKLSTKIRSYLSIMHRGLKQVESGDLGVQLKVQDSPDEFSQFIRAFNRMSGQLKDTLYSQAELQRIVDEKTQLLTMHANTDPLTQVYNRRKFLECGNKETELAQRYGRNLSVLMIDADDFKCINDTYGHHIGDEVLVKLTQSLKAETRAVDVIGRWGGEEFIILLPEADLKLAVEVAIRVSDSVRMRRFKVEGVEISVTVSIGVAELQLGETIELLIDKADNAMYQAKNSGKDQYQCFQQTAQSEVH